MHRVGLCSAREGTPTQETRKESDPDGRDELLTLTLFRGECDGDVSPGGGVQGRHADV